MSAFDVLLALNEDDVKPGWVAFGIVVAMGLALFIIMRSMAKHVRTADKPWADDPEDETPPEPRA